MKDSYQEAVFKEDWRGLRNAILTDHRENRDSVGLPPKSSMTTLQVASIYEQELASELIARGFSVDLHSACALGMTKEIEDLSVKHSLEAQVEYLTPMGFAILKGRADSIKMLLDCGDDPNRTMSRIGFFQWEIEALGQIAWSPIHAASVHGYHANAPQAVELLVHSGARIDEISALGCTSLALTAIYSWTSVMEKLIELGANINSRSEEESDLVWNLSAPAKATRSHGLTPLMIAIGEGQLPAVKYLLDHGSDRSLRDNNGNTTLHIAASPWWGENIEVLSELLNYDFAKNATNNSGKTPMELAEYAGYSKTCELLAT